MKYLIGLSLLTFTLAAFADIGIQCARPGKNNDVYLSDSRNGYDLQDKGTKQVGTRDGIQAISESRDMLKFEFTKRGLTKVYTFTNIKECVEEGTATVKLVIDTSASNISSAPGKKLNCECAAD